MHGGCSVESDESTIRIIHEKAQRYILLFLPPATLFSIKFRWLYESDRHYRPCHTYHLDLSMQMYICRCSFSLTHPTRALALTLTQTPTHPTEYLTLIFRRIYFGKDVLMTNTRLLYVLPRISTEEMREQTMAFGE